MTPVPAGSRPPIPLESRPAASSPSHVRNLPTDGAALVLARTAFSRASSVSSSLGRALGSTRGRSAAVRAHAGVELLRKLAGRRLRRLAAVDAELLRSRRFAAGSPVCTFMAGRAASVRGRAKLLRFGTTGKAGLRGRRVWRMVCRRSLGRAGSSERGPQASHEPGKPCRDCGDNEDHEQDRRKGEKAAAHREIPATPDRLSFILHQRVPSRTTSKKKRSEPERL